MTDCATEALLPANSVCDRPARPRASRINVPELTTATLSLIVYVRPTVAEQHRACLLSPVLRWTPGPRSQ